MRKLCSMVLMAGLVILAAACDDDEGPTGPEPPFTLTFSADASFQGAHGGQGIRVALVSTAAASSVVATSEGTVSATADPAFSVTFADVLEDGASYEIHYWIDSNFGGGTAGVCDPAANDHQWRVSVGPVTDDVAVEESHVPAETEDVCETFAADLTFRGDASFQGAHGGQMVSLAVVDGDGTVLLTDESVVSSAEDPSFEFDIDNALLIGESYEVHYWIDSNFGGGTEGTCDPPANDHQWSVDVATVSDDVERTDSHRPSETTSVCSSF